MSVLDELHNDADPDCSVCDGDGYFENVSEWGEVIGGGICPCTAPTYDL